MKAYKVPAQSGWRIFRWPLACAATTAIGLAAALIGDGAYDLVSWLALGLTLVAMVAAWCGWSAA